MKLPYDFGKYELRRELGKGSFARVYLAWHRALEQNMVLKILRPEIREEPELLERFKGEAKIMASMWHQNIVRVTDMDEWEESLYIAMEHVEGMDLEDWIKQHGTPPLEITLLMLADICRGLAMAHTRTIHRDIKPANMIFAHDGLVKLMDFGLARRIEDVSLGLTQVGAVMGTVAYMSPEQDMAEPLDRRTDIFSVGVVAYRLLTGDRPFPGSTSSEIRTSLRNREPRPLHELNRVVPPATARMVHSMLEKDRDRRCQKIEDAGAVFERSAARLGVTDGRALLRRYFASPAEVARDLAAHRRPVEDEAATENAPLDETVVAESTAERPLDETVVAEGSSLRGSRPRSGGPAGISPMALIALALVVVAGGAFAVVRMMEPANGRPDQSSAANADPAAGTGSGTSPSIVANGQPPSSQPATIPATGARTETRQAPAKPVASTTSSTSSLPRAGGGGTEATRRSGTAAVTPTVPPPAPVTDPPRDAVPPVTGGSTAAMGTLEVDLKPEVPVYVNDDRVSITGYKRMTLPRGTYTVRATYRDFEFRREVQVEPGRTAQVTYDLVLASTGRLRLTLESEEGWGNVILDGVRRREQAPGVLEGLSPGSHTISVEGPQYQLDGPPIRVEVVAGKTVDVPIRLKLKGADRK